MATVVLSPATISVTTPTAGPGRSIQRTKPKVTYIGGASALSGFEAHNCVASLGRPVRSQQGSARFVGSLRIPFRGKGRRRGGVMAAKCSAAEEIFRIAAIMNGLVLIGVAVGFVLLRIEAFVEEAE